MKVYGYQMSLELFWRNCLYSAIIFMALFQFFVILLLTTFMFLVSLYCTIFMLAHTVCMWHLKHNRTLLRATVYLGFSSWQFQCNVTPFTCNVAKPQVRHGPQKSEHKHSKFCPKTLCWSQFPYGVKRPTNKYLCLSSCCVDCNNEVIK